MTTVAAVPERETITREIRTAVRHMAVYGMGNVLVKALGFFMLPFYTHYLNPKDYGILEILDLSMSLFALVLSMGLTPALLRVYAAGRTAGEKREIVSTGCVFGWVAGAITFLAGVGLVRPATALIFGSGVPSTYVLLSFTAIVLAFMGNLPRTYLRALEKSGAFTLIDVASVFLLLVLNVVFIAGLKSGLVGVLWSSVITGALQCVLLSGWAFAKAGARFHRRHLERMVRFGAPLIFANLGLFVLNFSDRFFLQHLRSLDVVGVYAVGYKFGYMMNYLFVQPFFVMWQSRMYAIHAQAEHRKIFKQVFTLYSLGLVYAGLAMSLFGSDAVRLMVGAKFAAGANVIPVVVLAYIFYGLSYYTQLGMFLTDRTKLIGVIGATAAGLNLVLNYLLISYYGMMGAAWATVLSFAAIAIISYIYSQRVYRLPLSVWRVSGAMAVAALLYLVSRRVHAQPIWTALGLKAGILAAFPAVVWKSGLLPPSEAETLSSAGHYARDAVWRLMEGFFRTAVTKGNRMKKSLDQSDAAFVEEASLNGLTPRQARELEYHKHHASSVRAALKPISYEVVQSGRRRWWNAYWCMYDLLLERNLAGRTALVAGCGAGTDAIFLANIGAEVHAFDLSPDMLSVAEILARKESAPVQFRQMAAEQLDYPDDMFDVVLVRDLLHHCDLARVVPELVRVTKPGGFVVVDELYTHSILQRMRESRLGMWLYSKITPLIYRGENPYITDDERKLDETELRMLKRAFPGGVCQYFNIWLGRFCPPDTWDSVAKVDRAVIRLLGPLGYVLAGRFILACNVSKVE